MHSKPQIISAHAVMMEWELQFMFGTKPQLTSMLIFMQAQNRIDELKEDISNLKQEMMVGV